MRVLVVATAVCDAMHDAELDVVVSHVPGGHAAYILTCGPFACITLKQVHSMVDVVLESATVLCAHASFDGHAGCIRIAFVFLQPTPDCELTENARSATRTEMYRAYTLTGATLDPGLMPVPGWTDTCAMEESSGYIFNRLTLDAQRVVHRLYKMTTVTGTCVCRLERLLSGPHGETRTCVTWDIGVPCLDLLTEDATEEEKKRGQMEGDPTANWTLALCDVDTLRDVGVATLEGSTTTELQWQIRFGSSPRLQCTIVGRDRPTR